MTASRRNPLTIHAAFSCSCRAINSSAVYLQVYDELSMVSAAFPDFHWE